MMAGGVVILPRMQRVPPVPASVVNGTTKQKGDYGEAVQDEVFEKQLGYERIGGHTQGSGNTDPIHGLDGVYQKVQEKPGVNDALSEFVISEAKFDKDAVWWTPLSESPSLLVQ